MSPQRPDDFAQRWQALAARVRAADAGAPPTPARAAAEAARLAALGLAAQRAQRDAERSWRGLAAAAALFLVALLGLGAAAAAWRPDGFPVAGWPRLPATAFIPAPPRPPVLAALGWSPARVFSAVDAWLDPRTPPAETAP